MATVENEDELLRSTALQNAKSIEQARQGAEAELACAQESLRESHHVLSNVLDSITDGFIAVDKNWTVTYVNQRGEELLQPLKKTRATLLGKNFWAEFPALLGTPAEQSHRRAMEEQVTVGFENFYAPLDAWFSVRIHPAKDGISIFFQNISARKHAEQDRRHAEAISSRLAAIVESSEDAIISKTLEGIITTWNAGAERIFGYTGAEAIGQPIAMLIPADHINEEPAILERLKRGERIEHYETIRRRKNGILLNISLTISPVRDASGKIIGASKIARDITEQKRTAEILRQQREWFQVTLASIGDAVITTDTENRVTFLNPVAENLTGWKLVEALNQPLEKVFNIIHEKTRAKAKNPVVQVLREGSIIGLANHTALISKDGRETAIEDSAAPIKNSVGEILGAVMVFHDVTEQRRAEEAAARSEAGLHTLADSMSQLAWMAEPDGNLFWYNRRWYDYTGATFEDMKGWGWQKVHDPKILPVVMERWQEAIRTCQPFEMEFPLRGADGIFRRFLTRANPMFDAEGKVIRWFGTNTDIEFSKLAEEKIAVARDSAERANKAKDHFIAALSHELRTPLTPVLALLSNLKEDDTISQAVAADLETVRRNVELEVRLIDDLLDLTRITRDKLDLHYVRASISQIIEDAINTCVSDMNVKRVSLVREIKNAEKKIFTDSARITQVLWNLLKNSIKFTSAGGTITIRSYSKSKSGVNQEIIEVQDTGIGIESDQITRIFDAFEQGNHAITRQFGGLGLGLAISRAIAEAHHGTLTAMSEGHDRGSTFTLTLPLHEEFSKSISPQADGLVSAQKTTDVTKLALRILLVEDHADTANSLSTLLRRRGFVVSIATNVANALKLVTEEPFDLLISDLGLPDATGYELMQKVRQLRAIPGIALSGFGMEDDIKKCLDAGFREHLVKPIRIAQLEEVIGRVCAGS